jgi:hypothetical protein
MGFACQSTKKKTGLSCKSPAIRLLPGEPQKKDLELPSMTIALIANPSAGGRKGSQIIPHVESKLRRHHIDCRIFITQQHAHAIDIARQLTPASYDGVVSLGGDGTNFHVLNGFLKYHRPATLPPLGIIPVGRGNSFARDLGICTTADGIRVLIGGETRPVDVCSFTQIGQPWYFVNLAGFGDRRRPVRRGGRGAVDPPVTDGHLGFGRDRPAQTPVVGW